jgi:hypothetical protein
VLSDSDLAAAMERLHGEFFDPESLRAVRLEAGARASTEG